MQNGVLDYWIMSFFIYTVATLKDVQGLIFDIFQNLTDFHFFQANNIFFSILQRCGSVSLCSWEKEVIAPFFFLMSSGWLWQVMCTWLIQLCSALDGTALP